MRGTLPNALATDGQFLICPTNQSILGNCKYLRLPLIILLQNKPSLPPPAPQRHWSPITSQDGDGRSSGPGDPGLDNLGKNPYAADEEAFKGNSSGNSSGKPNENSAAPRSESIPGFVGFALSGLAAALVALL